jgi:hypothetical protein
LKRIWIQATWAATSRMVSDFGFQPKMCTRTVR